MSNDFISDEEDEFDSDEPIEEDTDINLPTTKLERRRLIEQMADEKKLREELAEFDF